MLKNSWTDIRPQPTPGQIAETAFIVTQQELSRANAMKCPRRMGEWLLWRTIVREHLGADTRIGYDENGAPILLNRPGHIGVSHCAESVAVIYSPHPCAIDIESLSRNFDKIAHKYICAAEMRLPDASSELFKAAVWCAKEAAYKYTGIPSTGFLNDIIITGSSLAAGTMTAEVHGRPVAIRLRSDSRTMLAVIE